MYSYVGSDGKWHPADLNRLKEWAQQGYVEPYAPVMDMATSKQTRADAIPELQPIFAARFEALTQQNAAAAAATAVHVSQSRKKSTYWAWGIAAVTIILIAVIRSAISDRPYDYTAIRETNTATTNGTTSSDARADYLPGPMPEKERQRIYWELGIVSLNAEKEAEKRFPTVRIPKHPSAKVLAREDARRKRSFAFLLDLKEKNKRQLAKKSELTRGDLDLLFNEGADKEWPYPRKVISSSHSK